MLNPAEIAKHGSVFSNLKEEGVRRALLVGVVLQVLQQVSRSNLPLTLQALSIGNAPSFISLSHLICCMIPDKLDLLQVQLSGINAVLYFTPQILMQSGAGDLLANIGIDGESASILASGVTCLLMLPCILMAMSLMDKSGRRSVLSSLSPWAKTRFSLKHIQLNLD